VDRRKGDERKEGMEFSFGARECVINKIAIKVNFTWSPASLTVCSPHLSCISTPRRYYVTHRYLVGYRLARILNICVSTWVSSHLEGAKCHMATGQRCRLYGRTMAKLGSSILNPALTFLQFLLVPLLQPSAPPFLLAGGLPSLHEC